MIKEFVKALDDDGVERLRVRLTIKKGKLTDVVFQYESLIEKKWAAIVRYDLAHGFFHRDVMKPNGEKEKTVIEITGLKEASIFAE
ncbi:MAG TPA: hypothetical protein VJY62_15465 [Bacteroidia bacterium]|nr:hypothetical protein [Bacteroidia bacterium]